MELTCHLAGLSLPCGDATTLVRQPDLVFHFIMNMIIIISLTR